MTKIILSADSTCDLGDELKAKYQVHYYPFHIILGDKQYQDNVDITPEEIFQAYWERENPAENSGYRRGGISGLLSKMGRKRLPGDSFEFRLRNFFRLSELLYGGPRIGQCFSH